MSAPDRVGALVFYLQNSKIRLSKVRIQNMDLHGLKLLQSDLGRRALEDAGARLPREADFLRHFDALSRIYPADLARAALETAILRIEAAVKFAHAQRMFFTRPALEQASGETIAAYRARRYAGFDRLADLACSIGADTLALAQHAPALGVDLDPLRLQMARLNLEALQPGKAVFVQADLTAALPFALATTTGLFFDPARRAGQQRIFSVDAYHPPLSVIRAWLPHCPALGVKISPGVNLDELGAYPAEIEFISVDRELKEAVLWFGPLRSAGRRATLLPNGASLSAGAPDRPGAASEAERPLPLDAPRAYLYEPDPAVLRAGLVRLLGEQLDAAQLDADIAYLTAERFTPTPFARAWSVEDWFPFQLKRLRAALRERHVSRVTVKKRGSPIEPEQLMRDLRLDHDPSGQERVLFLTHLRGKPIVILCYEQRF